MQMDGDESSNIEDRRGGGGFGGGGFGGGGIPIPIGGGGGGLFKGGIGFVAFIVIALIFGVDPMALLSGLGGGDTGSTYTAPATQSSRTARAPAADAETTFVSRVLKSTEDVWTSLFRDMGRQYVDPKLVLYRDATRTGCGTGQAAMGPFYCPADDRVYLDLGFFDDLASRFHAPGQFPQAYVIAHEVGHHVQNLLGITAKVDQMRQSMSKRDANALSVQSRAAGRLLRRRLGQPRRPEKRRQVDRRQGCRSGTGGRVGDRRRPAAEAGARPDRARQLHPRIERPAHALVPHRAGQRRPQQVRYVQGAAALSHQACFHEVLQPGDDGRHPAMMAQLAMR